MAGRLCWKTPPKWVALWPFRGLHRVLAETEQASLSNFFRLCAVSSVLRLGQGTWAAGKPGGIFTWTRYRSTSAQRLLPAS